MEFIDDMAEQTEKKEKEYLLPDGFGLSLEQVKNLINQQCGISIKNDDPIMCMVPILNAFLHEQQKLQEEYKEGLKLVYQEVLEEFAEEIDKKLAAASVVVRQESKYEEHRRTVYVLYTLVVILSFVLMTIYFWKF